MSLKKKIKLAAYILFFICLIMLFFLPADFFDSGQSVCLSVLIFNKQCYGCGMTRAIQHLIHVEFAEAAEYNKLSFIAAPLAVYVIIQSFYDFLKKEK